MTVCVCVYVCVCVCVCMCVPDVPLIKGSHSCLCKVCERRKLPLRPHPSLVCKTNGSQTHTRTHTICATSPEPLILGTHTSSAYNQHVHNYTQIVSPKEMYPPSVSQPPSHNPHYISPSPKNIRLPSKACGRTDTESAGLCAFLGS